MRALIILNGLALALVLFINYLSFSLPINGQTTGEISNQINVLLTPAGYVFSIWGLIYVMLGLWIIATWLSPVGKKVAGKVGYLFIINALLNISWIFAFHYERFILSLFIIMALLCVTFIIYKRLDAPSLSRLWQIPFTVYLAWVSIATLLNIGIVLKTFNVPFYVNYEMQWTIGLLVVLTLLAIWFSIKMNDLVYPLVFIWGFIGVAVKRAGEYPSITLTAWVMAGVLVIYVVYMIIKKKAVRVV